TERVLELGPQHIASRLLYIQHWGSFIETESNELTSLPLQVNFRSIPLNMRDPEGLARIASLVRKPIKLDRATKDRTNSSYGRVLVEVEASNKFPTMLHLIYNSVKIHAVNTDYNWMPVRYSKCKVCGHSDKSCPKQQTNTKATQTKIWLKKDEKKEQEVNEDASKSA
ncbi:hypothetical protein GIB67_035368, partial [Kingdonia uniflora]